MHVVRLLIICEQSHTSIFFVSIWVIHKDAQNWEIIWLVPYNSVLQQHWPFDTWCHDYNFSVFTLNGLLIHACLAVASVAFQQQAFSQEANSLFFFRPTIVISSSHPQTLSLVGLGFSVGTTWDDNWKTSGHNNECNSSLRTHRNAFNHQSATKTRLLCL